MTTRFSRSTSSLRSRFRVTYAVPQPSLTMSMWSPAVSRTSSHARGPRPLSSTCVRPPTRAMSRSSSETGIELLELRLCARLHVAVERVALRVDSDRERAEVLDAELPETLGHQILPCDVFDLRDLRRLESRRAADDREVDHPELRHRLDRIVGKAALAADRPHSVLPTERLGEAHHARTRRRADADLLVAAWCDLPHVRCRVEQKRPAQVERRLPALVEDPDLRPVPDADHLPLDDHLVARTQREDLLRVDDRERELVRRHHAAPS